MANRQVPTDAYARGEKKLNKRAEIIQQQMQTVKSRFSPCPYCRSHPELDMDNLPRYQSRGCL